MKLDVRGEVCPYPMMKALEAMRQLPEGELLEVLTDHPPSLETIPPLANQLGFAWKIVERGGGQWAILIAREAQVIEQALRA
jgi:tRNA 2-thiouridine synthesizing protein A